MKSSKKLFEESLTETTKIRCIIDYLGFQVIVSKYGESRKGVMAWRDEPRHYHPTFYMALRDVELAYLQAKEKTPPDVKTLMRDVSDIRKIILELDRKYRDKTLEFLGRTPKGVSNGHDVQDEATNTYRDVYGDFQEAGAAR